MITYRETHTYKYILEEHYIIDLPKDTPRIVMRSDYVRVVNGKLHIMKGYRWDGPSGPTIDTKTFMRGSLVHDVLYQLIRQGHFGKDMRKIADKLLVKICKEDGMNWFRSKWVYLGIRVGGSSSTERKDYPLLTAP